MVNLKRIKRLSDIRLEVYSLFGDNPPDEVVTKYKKLIQATDALWDALVFQKKDES